MFIDLQRWKREAGWRDARVSARSQAAGQWGGWRVMEVWMLDHSMLDQSGERKLGTEIKRKEQVSGLITSNGQYLNE